MSPIQAIKDWYVSLDNELQSDIAYMFVSLTLGDRQFAPAALSEDCCNGLTCVVKARNTRML
ncbi:hypothetical protein BDS110ZK18_85390 [Bradyrhizobium diazoefficiens]